jgi:hypothetical protein
MHRSELEATIVSQTKIMERIRNKLGSIVLGIEDEGDRAYFGSTNDADELRDIESDMLESLNLHECPWMHGRDLHAELRELRSKNRLLSHAANCHPDLVEALEEIANLHGEINPSNYDHDGACELNRQFCYAITLAAAALAKAREGGVE